MLTIGMEIKCDDVVPIDKVMDQSVMIFITSMRDFTDQRILNSTSHVVALKS